MTSVIMSRVFGIVVLILTLAGTWWTSREFRTHAEGIFAYLADPAVPRFSTDEQLNYHLARYGGDQSFALTLVENARMSLSPESRRNTIQRLGSFGLLDQTEFAQGGRLSDAVNEYLVDRLTLLGNGLAENRRNGWALLVNGISRSLGRRSVEDYIEARSRAQWFLDQQRLPDQILKAHRIFETYEIGPNPSDLTFFVGADPDPETFPTLITSATSESLLASDERTFQLYTVAGDTGFGDVRATMAEVFCDIRFLRPWLPENLLDDGIELTPEMATRHFGKTGSLRVVPVAMVVFVGLDVVFEIPETEAADVAASVETNRCCELKSPGLTFRLAPSSLRKVGELRYRGRTEPDDPRLIALVSRRRVPK